MGIADIGFILTNAVVLTCIYGMLAIGISITWSSVGLINLSYGFIFAAAGYGAWWASSIFPQNGAVVMIAGIAVGALGGLLVCALAFIPIHDKPNFPVRGMIATLAISLIGSQALMASFGPLSRSLPEIFGSGTIDLGDMVLTADKIGNVVTSIGFVALVVIWMRSSRRGLEIRAMMMNPHAAAIVGIGVRRTGFYVMAITGGMAGLAAVLLSQTYYISPFGGLAPMIKGVSIALCGGLGSVQGAIIAAIILGLNEAITGVVLGGQYVLITQFLLIIVILLIRPRGIAGIVDRAREA
jgi:branched-chain amino acid transport system permease protein